MTEEDIFQKVRPRFTSRLPLNLLLWAAFAVFSSWLKATLYGLDYANALLGTNRFWLFTLLSFLSLICIALYFDGEAAGLRDQDQTISAGWLSKPLLAMAKVRFLPGRKPSSKEDAANPLPHLFLVITTLIFIHPTIVETASDPDDRTTFFPPAWSQVNGRVLEFMKCCDANQPTSYCRGIRYQYKVGNHTYESDRVSPLCHSESESRTALNRLPRKPGQSVTVYYDPQDPSFASLLPEAPRDSRTASAFLIGLAVGFIVIILSIPGNVRTVLTHQYLQQWLTEFKENSDRD